MKRIRWYLVGSVRWRLRQRLLRWLCVRPDEVLTLPEYLKLHREVHNEAYGFENAELARVKTELHRTKVALLEACNENLRLRYE